MTLRESDAFASGRTVHEIADSRPIVADADAHRGINWRDNRESGRRIARNARNQCFVSPLSLTYFAGSRDNARPCVNDHGTCSTLSVVR